MVGAAMSVDPARFPLASRYLRDLPNGLDSFSECATRGESLGPYVRDFGRLASDAGLPKTVADTFRRAPDARWVSEAVFQTMNLVVRDLAFPTDEAFYDWTYAMSQSIFDKAVVRTLMRLMSPTLVIMGATKRWAAFHRGSTLTAGPVTETNGRLFSKVVLSYPAGLFPDLYLRGLSRSFLAALDGSRGKNARVELKAVHATSAEYQVSFSA
jgi:hypothetical protein